MVLAVYLLSGSGHLQTIDVRQELSVAASIRAGHGFETSMHVVQLGGAIDGRHDTPYAGHDIGTSLLFLPLTLVPGTVRNIHGRVCEPEGSTDCWTTTAHVVATHRLEVLAAFVPPLLGALLVSVFAELLVALGFDDRTVVTTALLLAFTSVIWVYAHISFDATPTALLVTTGALGVVRFHADERMQDLVLGAVALAGSVLVRSDSLAVAATLSIPVGVVAWRRRAELSRAVGILAAWALPFVVVVATNAWFNWLRFGSPTNNGHAGDPLVRLTNPIVQGLVAQVASRGKGMLFYSPLLIIALVGWPRFVRRDRLVAGTLAATIVVQLLVHAPLAVWSGDEAWAARHTIPVTALCFLPLAFVVRELLRRRAGRGLRVAVVVLSLAGVTVQLSGILADYQTVDATRYALPQLPLNDTSTFQAVEGREGHLAGARPP